MFCPCRPLVTFRRYPTVFPVRSNGPDLPASPGTKVGNSSRSRQMNHLVRGLSKCCLPAIGLFFLPRTFALGQDRPAAAVFRSAFEARYPKSDTSAAALEIERLAAALGIEMSSYEPTTAEDEKKQRETGKPIPFTLKAVKERPSPSP